MMTVRSTVKFNYTLDAQNIGKLYFEGKCIKCKKRQKPAKRQSIDIIIVDYAP